MALQMRRDQEAAKHKPPTATGAQKQTATGAPKQKPRKTTNKNTTVMEISVAVHNEMKKKIKEQKDQITQLKDASNRHGSETKALKDTIGNLEDSVEDLKNQVSETEDSDGQSDYDALLEKYNDALKALKECNRRSQAEEAKDVVRELFNYVRDSGYRTTKFAQDEAHLKKFATSAYEAIKTEIGLDNGETTVSLDEFIRIYSPRCLEFLSNQRIYNQAQFQKAAHSESTSCQ